MGNLQDLVKTYKMMILLEMIKSLTPKMIFMMTCNIWKK